MAGDEDAGVQVNYSMGGLIVLILVIDSLIRQDFEASDDFVNMSTRWRSEESGAWSL